MLVLPGVRVSAFDKQRWVINTTTGHNLLVNSNTAQLFELIQTAETTEQATVAFNTIFGARISSESFTEILKSNFGGYGILSLDKSEQKQLAGHYINFKVKLFSPALSAALAKPLTIFYCPNIFWPALVILLLFLSGIYLNYASFTKLPNEVYLQTIGLVYLSVFIHELGHIAACNRFRIRHGEVGFGFYLYIFPVLYADVSNIWQAARQHRIITNLGGIFSQLLYSSLLSGAYLVTGYKPLLIASMAVAASALWQLNPFVRYDGYWLLSDLTNTPNLLTKAAYIIKEHVSWRGFLRLIKSKGRILFNKKTFFLIYGLSNLLILLIFAYYSIVKHGNQLLLLPSQLTSILRELFNGRLFLAGIRQIPLVAVIFYLVALKYLFSAGLKMKAKVLKHQS